MSTQRSCLRMALAALCVCLLGLLSQASATDLVIPAYCTDINTSSMNKNTSEFQSDGLCEGFCSSYSFAILLGHGCWCSDYAPASSTDTSSCSNGCPGFPTDNCGNSAKGLYAYIALSKLPSGTEGASSSAAASTTAVLVTVTATPASVTITVAADTSSSSSSEISSSTLTDQASTTASETTTSSWIPTPVISVFTTTGEVRTVTVTPTAPPNSQSGLGVKKSTTGLGTGGAVGLTIGLVALIAVIGAVIFFCIRRRHQREADVYNTTSRRGSSAGLGGPVPSRTMSENSRYVLGTDGRQVVETWEPGDAPGSRRSRLMPVDPRLDPFAPVYQRGENKSRESMNTIRDDHDYSRRVVHQGPILRATNPDHPDD